MPAVLFDLDGTLTDSKLGIVRCIGHALEKLGHPVPEFETMDWCVGPPLKVSFPKLMNDESPELIAQAILHYRERFTEVGLFENAVYDGIPESLSEFRDRGFTLFVATSKPHGFATRILDHFELTPFFHTIYGSGFDGTFENKAELIAHILASEGLDPAETIMVGDREHDVIGAEANGIPCIGVTYGYGTPEELTHAGAALLCDAPARLLETVSNLLPVAH